MIDPDPAIAAASLILLRDRRVSAPELLIVRRGETLAFAPGAYVFPGGRVDPSDVLAAAARPDLIVDPNDGAARLAAIRETQEETGITDAADAAALIPFARWRPTTHVTRRFDTRFYLAQARDDLDTPMGDGVESAAAFWATAERILDDCRAGRGHAIFPTRRLLERLAQFPDFAAARDQATLLPERIISPWVERRADGNWLCIPADAGYPISEEPLATAARG